MPQQLSAPQEAAIDLLLAGTRETQVAEQIGVDRSTLWRWCRQNDAFAAELNRRRRERWDGAIERLADLVPKALDALSSELQGPNRVRVAALILDAAGFRADRKASVEARPRGPITEEGVAAARADAAAFQDLFVLTS